MVRALRAPLSPKEENALRKIAAGAGNQAQEVYLARLVTLELIEDRDGEWHLTEFGRLRSMGESIVPNEMPSVSSGSPSSVEGKPTGPSA